jgi:hypothetical protein
VGHQFSHTKMHSTLSHQNALYRRAYLADRPAPSSALHAGAEGLKQHSRLHSGQPRPQMHVGSSCAGRATMFRLQRGGRPPSRESRDMEGVEVPDVRSEHRPPNPFYPSGDLPRYRREKFFKSLTYLGPAPKAHRSHPRASQGSQSFPLARYVDLVPADVYLHPGGALQLLHLGQGLYGPQIPSVAALLQTGHL